MPTLDDINRRLDRVSVAIATEKRSIDLQRGVMKSTKAQIVEERKRRDSIEEGLDVKTKAREFLSSILRRTETDIENLFGDIGTAAIEFVFSENRRLRFKFEPRNSGGMGVKIRIVKPSPDDDGEIETSTSFEGGGMRDVVALSMRIAMMELYVPKQDGPIMLDETVKSLADDEAIQGVGEFLRKISDEMGRQIIVITHKSKLASYADRSFSFTLGPDDSTKVRVIDGRDEEDDS